MPVSVIDRLKVVQIDEHQRAIAAAALAGRHCLAQTIVERQSVRELRQCVIEGQMVDLVLASLRAVTSWETTTTRFIRPS